jgi:hypothetical protein
LVVGSPLKPTVLSQSISNDTVSVKFALPICVEEKIEPFLDEKFEINSLEQTIEMGLNNFKTAGKRKREQEVGITINLYKTIKITLNLNFDVGKRQNPN